MIPFKDDNPTRTFPFVTIFFIAANIIIFFIQFMHPAGHKAVFHAYGAVPSKMFSLGSDHMLNVFSAMFLHGGFFHIAGNMLYLWIFGNNIEDRLGHFRFFVFYFLCGTAAAYSHAVTNPASNIPMIGASGAVSGILGAYLLLYPRAKVHTIIFFGFFVNVIKLPAIAVIGFWAVIQLINGVLTAGLLNNGGVAWFAHIGGFIFGILIIKLYLPKRRKYW